MKETNMLLVDSNSIKIIILKGIGLYY